MPTPSGTTSSAAADGVGALRSAIRSEMVTSISCPTAETIGIVDPDIALATGSSLKAQRSSIEPPPRPTMITSGSPVATKSLIASEISLAAPSPCTLVPRTRTRTHGALLLKTEIISLRAAPVVDVTMPTTAGCFGRGCLRAGSSKPSVSS